MQGVEFHTKAQRKTQRHKETPDFFLGAFVSSFVPLCETFPKNLLCRCFRRRRSRRRARRVRVCLCRIKDPHTRWRGRARLRHATFPTIVFAPREFLHPKPKSSAEYIFARSETSVARLVSAPASPPRCHRPASQPALPRSTRG